MKKFGLTRRTFSPEFKSSIQNKILLGELTGVGACKTYGISRTTIYRWIAEINTESSDIKSMSRKKPSSKESKDELEARIKSLEKSLEFEQLKTEAYELLIKEAEEKFKIQIEKKSGPK